MTRSRPLKCLWEMYCYCKKKGWQVNTDRKVCGIFHCFLQIREAAQIKSREKGDKHIVLKL